MDTSSTSYLGVELSSDLRWNKQVKKTMAKGNQTPGVLKRNLRHCPRSINDMAYKTILLPKLEYASAVWDPFTWDNICKMEAVQRRAARFVCNSYKQTASVSSMLNELSWPLLEQRRAEARLGLFYPIVHKSVDIDAATLITRSTRPTRKANEVQYTRHMTSKDCYKFSFMLLLLSTHSSLIIGGSPLLLSYGGSPPASPASHLAGLLRRRDPSTNPGPIAWWVSVGN